MKRKNEVKLNERNEAKRNILKQNEGETISIYIRFEAKRSKTKTTEAKRKNTEAKRSEKKNL
jgi:hypothetical protein